MSTIRRVTALSFTAGLSLTALLASGCDKKIADVCATKCADAADVQTCTSSNATAEATAEERGCEAEFEAYASCLDAKGTCTKGVLDGTTACPAESKTLQTCLQ